MLKDRKTLISRLKIHDIDTIWDYLSIKKHKPCVI